MTCGVILPLSQSYCLILLLPISSWMGDVQMFYLLLKAVRQMLACFWRTGAGLPAKSNVFDTDATSLQGFMAHRFKRGCC